jgi:hypothetical protein|nr:MAG TPA: hypothetical protein [Caudoviricetes sp.]
MARTLLTTAPVRFYTNERSLNKYKAIMNFNRIYDPQKREQNGYKIFAAEDADIDFYASFLSQIEIGPRWRSITCLTRDESKIPAHQRRNDKAVWFIAECWPGQALDGAEFLVLQMPEETIKKIINGREESSERTYTPRDDRRSSGLPGNGRRPWTPAPQKKKEQRTIQVEVTPSPMPEHMKGTSSRRDKFSNMNITSKTKPIERTANKPVQVMKPIASGKDIDNAASALATAWGVKYNDK